MVRTRARDIIVHARQRHLALCRNKVFMSRQGLGLGDQGRDIGFPITTVPCGFASQPWTVSRQGVVVAERPCVATWN